MIIDTEHLDRLVQRLMDAVPSSLKQLHRDLDKNFRAILQSAFKELDLVTREEFDAQVGVLHRTREKLKALEKQVEALEKKGVKRKPKG